MRPRRKEPPVPLVFLVPMIKPEPLRRPRYFASERLYTIDLQDEPRERIEEKAEELQEA